MIGVPLRRRVVGALLALVALASCSSTAPQGNRGASSHSSTEDTTTASSDKHDGALVPADNRLPAAGACPQATAGQVVIDINPDTPAPRCVVVSALDHLKVVNTSNTYGQHGATVAVNWARYPARTLHVGQSTVYPAAFGTYLARGVHLLRLSLYSGAGGAEIWLR